MRLVRIQIRDWRSIRSLDVEVPPHGLGIAGPNEIGKTNIIRALRAALEGNGVSPEAIRSGAESCEVMVWLDDPRLHECRLFISQSTKSCKVKTEDGDTVGSPREKLREVLGLSAFAPLEFYAAKPAEQRRQLLAAMPVSVTPDDFKRWTGESIEVAQGRNGLDVLAEVREDFYARRTAANKEAATKASEYERARAAAESVTKPELAGIPIDANVLGDAERTLQEASEARAQLYRRKADADTVSRKTEGARGRVATLRAEAEQLRADIPKAPSEDEMQKAISVRGQAEEEVQKLELAIVAARAQYDAADKEVYRLKGLQCSAEEVSVRLSRKLQLALDIEATLNAATIDPPTAEELAAADAAVVSASAHATLVMSAKAAHEARSNARALQAQAEGANAVAERLDTIVNTLTVDAQVELAERANLIPGLSVTKDGVLYQGRSLDDGMSGAQRLAVAVQIAKRLNSQAKMILVDEIGTLDEDHLRAFVRLCTDDDWQLIFTYPRCVRGEDGQTKQEIEFFAVAPDDDQPLDPKRRVKVLSDAGKELA